MTESEWVCQECENVNTRKACAKCDAPRPAWPVLVPSGPLEFPLRGLVRLCPFDGGTLDAQGYCPTGQGFPVTCRCPFVCQTCRRGLEWSGACFGCHGSRTPADRRTWTFPGDRYETHDDTGRPIGDGQHWVCQVRSPRPACPPEQNEAEAAMLARVLAAVGTGRLPAFVQAPGGPPGVTSGGGRGLSLVGQGVVDPRGVERVETRQAGVGQSGAPRGGLGRPARRAVLGGVGLFPARPRTPVHRPLPLDQGQPLSAVATFVVSRVSPRSSVCSVGSLTS